MKIDANSNILTLVSFIQETDDVLKRHEKHLPELASQLMIRDLEEVKSDFIKQLLAALLESPHNIADIEPFLFQATAWLRKFDRKGQSSGDLSAHLKEVERGFAVAA